MPKYFNFYDPLEKRYIFNSFLVIVALVEILILVFTLIWRIDMGIFSDQVQVAPFPWKEYLVAAFAAPIALVFLFGVIVRAFEIIARQDGEGLPERRPWALKGRRSLFLLAGIVLLALLAVFQGRTALAVVAAGVRGLGLGGAYLLIALVGLGLLYLPLRLLLRYRLQKKAMEYQYLLTLAERYGVAVDPRDREKWAAELEKKNSAGPGTLPLPAPENSEE